MLAAPQEVDDNTTPDKCKDELFYEKIDKVVDLIQYAFYIWTNESSPIRGLLMYACTWRLFGVVLLWLTNTVNVLVPFPDVFREMLMLYGISKTKFGMLLIPVIAIKTFVGWLLSSSLPKHTVLNNH
jgi:hypothetical protein